MALLKRPSDTLGMHKTRQRKLTDAGKASISVCVQKRCDERRHPVTRFTASDCIRDCIGPRLFNCIGPTVRVRVKIRVRVGTPSPD